MKGLTTGAETRRSAYCPNCRTTGVHVVIDVTTDLALIWCARCGVPHAGEGGAAINAPSEIRAPLEESRTEGQRRRWFW